MELYITIKSEKDYILNLTYTVFLMQGIKVEFLITKDVNENLLKGGVLLI